MDKKKMTAGKVILRIFLVLLSLFLLAAAGGAAFVFLGKAQTAAVTLSGVSPQSVADGTYEGNYSAFRWSNTVEVTVKDHRIVSIDYTKPQALAKPETIEALTEHVIATQNTMLDGVSSATLDSKAFLSAVEDALNP